MAQDPFPKDSIINFWYIYNSLGPSQKAPREIFQFKKKV